MIRRLRRDILNLYKMTYGQLEQRVEVPETEKYR